MPQVTEPRVPVMFHGPVSLRQKLEDAAAKKGLSIGVFVRDLSAKAVGYTGDLGTGSRSKYATPEEREAAMKAKKRERADLIRELLKRHSTPDETAG